MFQSKSLHYGEIGTEPRCFVSVAGAMTTAPHRRHFCAIFEDVFTNDSGHEMESNISKTV
jgi:hypothetical protein